MIDVYIYESRADAAAADEERFVEEWRDVPCAPRVGDTIFLRKDLGKGNTRPVRKVVAVEWFNARDERSPSDSTYPTPLHAYVTLESAPSGSADGGG